MVTIVLKRVIMLKCVNLCLIQCNNNHVDLLVALNEKVRMSMNACTKFVPIHPVYVQIFCRISGNFNLLLVLQEKPGSHKSFQV